MVMCMSLAVPEKVQSLARRIGMGLSSFWESASGGMTFSLPVSKCGSEVPSPAGETTNGSWRSPNKICEQEFKVCSGNWEKLGDPWFFEGMAE